MNRLALAIAVAVVVSLLGALAAFTAQPINFALASNGAVITGPRNSSKSAGLPPVINDGAFDGYAWAYLKTPVLIQFAQPQTINTIDMLLHHEKRAWYRFYAEVSPDGETWQKVAERADGHPRGWQKLTFEPIQCRRVRVTFTDTSISARSYHIVEIGAFMLPDPTRPSPLRLAYQDWLKHARRKHDDILLHFLGENARMTPEEAQQVLKLGEGEHLTKDLDGDGDPDIADFLDTDPRHTIRPILVRVIDDDDDMGPDGKGDCDSDCYIADWRANGEIDRAIDYWDEDGDGDADRMDIYYKAGAWHHGNKVEVVIIRDIGDDNKMWWTRNYGYDQGGCQWKCDFNGDESFCMFGYDDSARQFVAWLEEPFTHHDMDGDGVAEMTLQFMGSGLTVRTLRFSFDADNDSEPEANRRDYDFSFNCVGRLVAPEDKSTFHILRNGEATGRYLDWPFARELAEAGDWKSCRLCWDEIDNNVNPASKRERDHERWEGVGGYPMREGNKRWETDRDYSGNMQLYYWPLDRRLHLFGAETGYINIDYNHDYKTDAKILYKDQDGDGFFDLWSYDADADGKPEHTIKPEPAACELIPINYDQFVERYRGWLRSALSANEALVPALKKLLGEEGASVYERWWIHDRPKTFYASEKLGRSPEARRYYLDLIREELFLRAKARSADAPWWREFQEAYDAGEFERATDLLPPAP